MTKVERPKTLNSCLRDSTNDEVKAMIDSFSTKRILRLVTRLSLHACRHWTRAMQIRTFKIKTLIDKDDLVVMVKGNKERKVQSPQH